MTSPINITTGAAEAILDYKEHTVCVYSHNNRGYSLYWAEIVGPLAPTGYRIWSTFHSVSTCIINAIASIDDRIEAGDN